MKLVCNFYSYVLQRAVDITVVIPSATCPESLGIAKEPATHVVKEKFPVLYLLHGFGNNHMQWTGYTNVEMYAEERRIAVVNMAGENKSYSKIGGDDFMRFVDEELPEFVTNMFPISSRPEDTYIAGLSMGGYGALLHGLSHPERFHAIGAFSAAVNLVPAELADLKLGSTNKETSVDDAYNLQKLADKVTKFPAVYMSCGDQDALYEADITFANMLKERGADVTWDEEAGKGHEWRFWDHQVEKFLDWIPREDYYQKLGKRSV